MKKIILSTACGLALVATTALATPVISKGLSQLNVAVEKVLAPYRDANTEARLEFQNVRTDAARALEVKINAFFSKMGPGNKLVLTVNDLSYDYGNGQTPTTKFEGSLATDLTKILPQSDLNDLFENLEATVQDLASQYIKDYGSAVTLTVNVTDKLKNAKGDYTAVKANLTLAIDLSKLPANKKAEDVPVTLVTATLDLNVAQGVYAKATAISNPNYVGFKQDEMGLKEYLDLLLNQDPEALKTVDGVIKQINDIAADLVK